MVKVAVTGGAGRIAYSLIPMICSGSIFGKDVRVDLRLLDIEQSGNILEGVKREIQDCGYDLLDDITVTTDQELAFKDVEVAVILGGYPRLPGMERKDLIAKNAEGMLSQARALNEFASKQCKVVVVANPANTNCLVALKCATTIPAKNFTCLTRLDHERLVGLVAEKVNETTGSTAKKVTPNDVMDVCIFGNHSSTQVPYTGAGKVNIDGNLCDIAEFIDGNQATLTSTVQNRGAEIIQYLKASSAMSAATAVAKHLRDWLAPDFSNKVFSMGILSDGNPYCVPDDLVYSFPCRRVVGGGPGDIEIVPNWPISEEVREMLAKTSSELVQEKSDAMETLTVAGAL
jgi:malate dehydrogenase